MKIFKFYILLFLVGCASMGAGPLIDQKDTQPVKLKITNNGRAHLTEVLLARCDAMTMGFNRLDSGEDILVGEEKIFELSPGCWKLHLSGGGYGSGLKLNLIPHRNSSVEYK